MVNIMEISKQRKLLSFRKSKINKILNKINFVLFLITVSGFLFYYFLIILLSGLSMWRPIYEVGMPLKISDAYITDINNLKIHLVDVEDDNLKYYVFAKITVSNDLTISNNSKYGLINKISLNDFEIEIDNNKYFHIPKGIYDLKLELSQKVKVDTYKGVTSIEVYLVNYENTTLSDFFRPLPGKENQYRTILITSSSTGKYVPGIYRTPFYLTIDKIKTGLIIYSIPNFIKNLVLFILTKDARLEKTKKD